MPDPIADLRDLQRRHQAREISEADFKRAFADLDKRHAITFCENGDGEIADFKLDGHVLCGACALLKMQLMRGA